MFVGFNLHKGTAAVDKMILRPGKVPASQYKKPESDSGDSEPEAEEDEKNPAE
jgi:hypothetical protein